MNLYQVIKRPLVTEKSLELQQSANQYAFAVDPKATKHDVREAVETIYKVKVTGVRTQNMIGKSKRVGRFYGRRPNWKKAIVVLGQGESIKLFESA